MPDLSLDLAVIGNGSIASLVSREGTHLWCCWPRLDGDPVFHGLLSTDEAAGRFAIRLEGQVSAAQRYLPNTAIIETILRDGQGNAVRVIDFCPRFKLYGRIFRPLMLVRRIEPMAGLPRIKIALRPGFTYGAQHPRPAVGSNHLRYTGPDFSLRVTTDLPLTHILSRKQFYAQPSRHVGAQRRRAAQRGARMRSSCICSAKPRPIGKTGSRI